MRRYSVLAAAVLSLGAAQSVTDAPPPTLAELQNLPDDCPLIYDNDWLRDVVDDDYVFLKAHMGLANLKGVVLSKDLWEWGSFYSLDDARRDFDGEYAIIRRMGLRNVPDYVIGADRLLARPSSGRIEDTAPVDSPGARLIVEEALKASPQKPLVVFVGGPINTVASAYLMNPSICDRMVVMMIDITGYNGKDPWANYVVANRCRLVNFGASRIWWPKSPSVLPPERFDALPQNDHVAEMKRVVTTFDHSLGDGAGPMLFFRPESWKAVVKCLVTGVFSFQDVNSDPYDFLDASSVDFGMMGDEFFSTVEAAYSGGGPAPPGRDPEDPDGAVNGLDYAYYEGTWDRLPDFAALGPVKRGEVGGFDLTPRARNDFFGFRFSGYVKVPADGTYKFFTSSDDGSRLYVGSTLVVDNDGLHAMQEREGTIVLKAGAHALTVDFFERDGGEGLEVRWEGPGISKGLIPASALYRVPAGGGGGGGAALAYEYYEGTWDRLPDFGALAAAKRGTVGGFDLSVRARDDNFGFVFTGTLEVPAAGDWTFFTSSDDGSRLWIDGALVVDNDGVHAMQERSGTVALSAGPHALRVEFFERDGGEGLVVSWQGHGVGKQEIPSSSLSAAAVAPPPSDGAILEGGGGEGEEGCGLLGLEAAVLAALLLWRGAWRSR